MLRNHKRYLITAALPYANGPKHIGHLAGAYLPADVFVRYLRSQEREVLFVCGSDEHGTAIANQAMAEGTTPRAIIDKYHVLNKNSFEQLGISFDIFHRTSEALHHETASEFFTSLHNKGIFKEEISEQYFDEKAGQFLADRYIKGTCPKCGYDSAYGDQCERCGSSLSPEDLLNPHSTLSGEVPVKKSTKHWYLPLDAYESWLKTWILEGHKQDWKATVYGQCKSWIDAGLHPRAVTRDLDWGVPVPLNDAKGKVLYVWFDAPIGYISATRQWCLEHQDNWEKWWKDEETCLVHFIGKDNIVFHCLIFPVMLHAHGGYVLPENVPANEFMNLEGDKMSTSRHWSIEMHEYLEDFPGKPDILRYCLLSNLPEQRDSEFTWKDFQARNNNELVAILGNFVNRTLVLTHKYFNGVAPSEGSPETADADLLNAVRNAPSNIAASLEQYRIREAMAEMMNLARAGNKYLADTEPWKIDEAHRHRVEHILYMSLQVCANLSILMEPFLPFTAAALRGMLNINKKNWQDAGKTNLLPAGHKIQAASLLFSKIEDSKISEQLEKLHQKKANSQSPSAVEKMMEDKQGTEPQKEETSYDEFMKMDLRIATVLEAVRVPKTDKLLQLTIDTGIDQRTIVSGIAEHYSPEDMIGRKIVVLANLAPRKIKGIESKGMILMASDNQGRMRVVSPVDDVDNGALVK
jgi:methionyl-tRNA synthetase